MGWRSSATLDGEMTMGILYRSLNKSDTDEFLRLKQLGLNSDPKVFVASLEEDDYMYQIRVAERLGKCSINSGDIIIGAFDDHLVGIISITRDQRIKRHHKADLHGMYVLPEYRGKQIGKTLMSKALAMAARMEGLEEIQLIVSVSSVSVINLYEKFGFHIEWTEKRALKVNDEYVDAHHMVVEVKEFIEPPI